MLSQSLVVLDFETTGLAPLRGDRITEVAVVRIEGAAIVDRYASLVNCGVRVPPFITSYTGITQRMVDTAPSVDSVMRELARFIGDAPVLAHNASFDQRFFASECEQVGLPAPDRAFLCSLKLARRVYPQFRSHSLGELSRQLRVGFQGNAHRAAADAEVTAGVVLRLASDLKARHPSLNIDARLLASIMRMPAASAAARLERLAGG